MTVKEVLIADLQNTLEEAGNLMVDKMVLESLAKNGSISLDEAEFYNTLVKRVITEAAEEFVPDSLLIQEGEGEEPMILTGEDGTVYSFNPATCELTPVENTGGAEDNPSVEDFAPEAGAEVAEESEKAEEGSELTEATELTESQQIVSNLIKSLNA